MYDLIQLTERTYYIKSPTNIGLVKAEDGSVCLIDSGNDKDAGRRVRQLLDANGWRLSAICNTHANADHIGGNRYLQGQTGCAIYAPGIDCAITRHPILEPSFLYGGYPCRDLRHKFLLAQESDARVLPEGALPGGLQPLPLPGHYFDMVGYRTVDDVLFLADSLCSREILDKYGITFVYDVAAYLKTLEMIKTLSARVFVPSHTEATEHIAELAQYNIDKVGEIAERILGLCAEPLCFEVILQKLFTLYGLSMNFEQYVLVGNTVRSYLAWLRDSGRLSVEFTDSMMLWKRV